MKYFLFTFIFIISNNSIAKTEETYFSFSDKGINYNLKPGKKIAEGSAGIIYETLDKKNRIDNNFVIKKFKNIFLYKFAKTSYHEEKALFDKLKNFDLVPPSFFFDSKNVIIKQKLNGAGLYEVILKKNKYPPEEYQKIINAAADLFVKIFYANMTLQKRNDFFWDLHGDNVMFVKPISTNAKLRWYIIDLNLGKPSPLLRIANIKIEGKSGFMTNIFDYTCRNYLFKNFPKKDFPHFVNELNVLIKKIALKVLATKDEDLIKNSQVFFNFKLLNSPNTIRFVDEFKNCGVKK